MAEDNVWEYELLSRRFQETTRLWEAVMKEPMTYPLKDEAGRQALEAMLDLREFLDRACAARKERREKQAPPKGG